MVATPVMMGMNLRLPSVVYRSPSFAPTVGRFSPDAEVPFPASGLGGVVEGVVVAVGEVRHDEAAFNVR